MAASLFTSYESDFFAWTRDQAARLRAAGAARVNLELDWENLAEEIESMGRSDRREIRSRLRVLLHHLLKYQFSTDFEPRAGWRRTIREQRRGIADLIVDSPSLSHFQAESLIEIYPSARDDAADDLNMPVEQLPDRCPFDPERELLNATWLPEPPPSA